MLPNFAYETSPAPEFLPRPRQAEKLSSHSSSRSGHSSEALPADGSHPSFKSSLREASGKHADGRGDKSAENAPDAVRHPHRVTGSGRLEPEDSQAATDDSATSELENSTNGSDESHSDSTLAAYPETGDNETGLDSELAGSGAATATAPLNESADPILSMHLDPTTAKQAAIGDEAQPSVNQGEMPASGPGANPADPKVGMPSQNDMSPLADPQLATDQSAPGASAADKGGTLTSQKNAGGTQQAGTEGTKGWNKWAETAEPHPSTDPLKVADRPDFGTATGAKSDAADRPVQPLQQDQLDQNVSGQRPQKTKAVPNEEASVIRTSEVSGEQQGAGRMKSDLLQGHEGEAKNEPVSADEAAPKIAKPNPGGKDSAFMQHQDQNFERLMDSTASTREKDSPTGLLRTQTMNQIVDKAVYQLKNEQNLVRIDLKPEFLGQVRMQIVTVDHQVSIRISAELPVVKEMLENNLQQLKANLQQQGLEVDEIEVSVSADSRHSAQNQKMKSELLSQLKIDAEKESEPGILPEVEKPAQPRTGNLAVDMFV